MADAEADAVVVGGGPAGVAAAVALRRRGIGRVILLERDGTLGGATRHCGHPPFGLREFGRVLTGPGYARRLARLAAAAGVEVRLHHSVVTLGDGGRLTVATPSEIAAIGGRRVVLATGAREASRAARLIGGDRPAGVMNTGTFQAMVVLERLIPFRRPLIVGTELVGQAAVATCLRHGIRPAMVIENAPRPVARWPLTALPRLAGIPVRCDTRLVSIGGAGTVDHVVVRTGDGPPERVACDAVLLTGCFLPEACLLRAASVLIDAGSGGPAVDAFGRCSDPAYIAAGNLLRPIESAGWCFREGTLAGAVVAADLAGALPAPGRSIAVERGHGIRLAMPQRVTLPIEAPAMRHLQLRLDRPHAGRLAAVADGRTVWSRPLRQRPERRILVPMAALAGAAGASTLRFELG